MYLTQTTSSTITFSACDFINNRLTYSTSSTSPDAGGAALFVYIPSVSSFQLLATFSSCLFSHNVAVISGGSSTNPFMEGGAVSLYGSAINSTWTLCRYDT